ncbi:hypothetical protein TGPRC2_213065 [Toxoplasma gondii TgCatPRC2]|uniref:Uncharacterized protein n=8 Tax=Toxoplasma gondii TaxID=5811 RepID=A0A125YTK7_TOXGV|nr:hypothetical protein TGME49_213065 [Toxoplasma gondii ME49]ESS30746.1 hypothetical protein TGVEG_213065 [Toxoplasma gondii VEG]KFG40361.1 hypothetical protein TGDOM2_213065 [Toxoplasma gondii GAB2-2007-GAL-DOM2]KFG44253.1 hypothetical protein TGP89_213065 [Toxoplasma gondii p89]KFH10502.1 hypothetical protein TGMAS_213065 [Toxoplasma gondii MAS]KYF43653.1 hypothetical protein TGARI_213065 [Toxoplasma gondii ARI]KYK68751.1 hypothetical protein TGPRC2_213065 [Toxoplasma gondii TgCatPRC2]PIM|eukprot:XP_018637876.1 hypothetical protein TGME49_213065 [Toxoplasma gondii ME49]
MCTKQTASFSDVDAGGVLPWRLSRVRSVRSVSTSISVPFSFLGGQTQRFFLRHARWFLRSRAAVLPRRILAIANIGARQWLPCARRLRPY